MTTVGRWSPNKVRARVLDGTWPEPLAGMVLMKPTSVAKTGASSTATIGANGSVTFGSCETLSLNGVFTTDYDNYMVVIRSSLNTNINNLFQCRLRTGGVDANTNYTYQMLRANGSTASGARTTSATLFPLGFLAATQRDGVTANFYGPFLAQPTAIRGYGVGSNASAIIDDYASTHSTSTSYDGFTVIVASGELITGLISVYGLVGT